MSSRRLSSADDLARIDRMTNSDSRNHLALAARTRPCRPLHPPQTVRKVMVANRPAAMPMSLTTSLLQTMTTRKRLPSCTLAASNFLSSILRGTTTVFLLRQFKQLTLHLHSAIILNLTGDPFLSTCHRTQHLQRRASTATTRLLDSANLLRARLRATIITILIMVPSTVMRCI